MKTPTCVSIGGAAVAILLTAGSVHAGQRTFVSAAGSDGNLCTPSQPCATFQRAHDVTDPSGEISCLDSSGYAGSSGVLISKSITIDCAGTVGAVNGGAITVNAPGAIVRLRNLTLNGSVDNSGSPFSGTIGVNFINGEALFIESCSIGNYNNGIVGQGIGVKFAPPDGVTAELYVKDSIIDSNGRTNSGGGIIIQPTGSSGARVTIENTQVVNNTYGIFANGMGSTGTIIVQIHDSLSAGSAFNGISAFTASGASIVSITADRSAATLNGQVGILSQGSGAFVLLADTTAMSNGVGLNAVGGGTIFTYQNNHLTGNVNDGAPTATLTVK
jgi:hypothetical protein